MSFQIGGKNNKKRAVISDINITPFVDVLLVLLIIFMVAAPMMTSSIEVDLPSGVDSSHSDEKIKPVIVSVKSDGSVFIEENICKLSLIGSSLKLVTNNNLNNKIYIRADKKLDYGRVMQVVQKINESGFTSVSLATEISQ